MAFKEVCMTCGKSAKEGDKAQNVGNGNKEKAYKADFAKLKKERLFCNYDCYREHLEHIKSNEVNQ